MVMDNAHLIALNRITGHLVWDVVMPEEPQHYGSTVSPLIVKDTVIAGVSGGDWGIRGFVACFKASTGQLLWRRWTIPLNGEPGSETWKGKTPLFGGGSTWLTGVYDPQTDTLYWPTGNPWPDSEDRDRPGDNLYTNSILALNPGTGELKWHYQFTPHDTHDWDATEPPVLVDTQYGGKPRKLLLHADRNGIFYVLDRTDGKLLLTRQFTHRLTWTSGVGPDGRPQPVAPQGMICPTDAANWDSAVFSPATRLYYVLTLEQCRNERKAGRPKGQEPVEPAAQKYLRAMDIDTGKVAWKFRKSALCSRSHGRECWARQVILIRIQRDIRNPGETRQGGPPYRIGFPRQQRFYQLFIHGCQTGKDAMAEPLLPHLVPNMFDGI
jgi:PQQ-dependent dehydrogenase (methanol/ethanol family)